MAEKNFAFEEIPETMQSQYAASPKIVGLADIFKTISPQKDIEIFYKNIFDIDTAKGCGLDIWGRIIGIGREIEVESSDEYFGFDLSDESGFDNDAFFSENATNTFLMPDDAYRQYLLLTKAFANISDSTAPAINYILSQLFKNKTAYVFPVDTMQIRFVFEFALSDLERSVFNLGLLTRGAGVGYEYYEIETDSTFGFLGSELENFNNGVFDVHGIKKVE